MNPRHNELLGAMPTAEFETFFPHLELVSLRHGQTVFNKGEVPAHVYFPVGALVSIICQLEDGVTMETNMVGKSSLLGLSNYGVPSFYQAWVRKSGLAYRMSLPLYRQLHTKCPVYLQALNQAQLISFRYISITAVCGKNHLVEQQIARWMLINLDRSFESTINITHGDIAALLGFRREVITLALGKLEEAGAIQRGRGVIEVVQREALENISCDCYWLISGKPRTSFTQLVTQDKALSKK